MVAGEHFDAYRQHGLESHAAAITFTMQFACLTAVCLYSFMKNVRAIWLLLFLFTLSRTCAFFLRATLTSDHRVGRGPQGLRFWMFYQAIYPSGIAALVSALYLCVLDHASRSSSFMPPLMVHTFRLNRIFAHIVLALGVLFVAIGTSVSNFAQTRSQRAVGHNLYQASFMFYTFLLVNLTWQALVVLQHLPSKKDVKSLRPKRKAMVASNAIPSSSKHHDTGSATSSKDDSLAASTRSKPDLTEAQVQQASRAFGSRWPVLFMLGNIVLLLIREVFFLATWNDAKAQGNEVLVFNLATMPEILAVCCFLPKDFVLQRWALGRTQPMRHKENEDKEKNAATEKVKKPKHMHMLSRFFASRY